MTRTLLLCFVHGFKGTDDTFKDFPYDLKKAVEKDVPAHRVESVVYPKYETKGELSEAAEAVLEWLKERVMEIRKKHHDKPWPPNDRQVGVILVAHSMGGFVAVDTLFHALEHRAESQNEDDQIFPLIQGILTFDTPYNGLARSMFVYGAFSNYSKVSSVFNVMTALGAAAPATLSRLGTQRATSAAVTSSAPVSTSPAWKTWQLVAVRTGTVGAIAAGGVAAYTNREAILRGMKSIRNLNRETVMEGYRQSVESLGQGLAYINRGNVGHSFAWLSDHFTFVGALLKQKELSRRLDRMAALKGIGIKDFYTSIGENGYWSGGYFVPERTFCAVPEEEHAANHLFTRCTMRESSDEIQAHLGMFNPAKNKRYEQMTEEAAEMAVEWFLSEEPIVDDPKFREVPPEEKEEYKTVEKTLSNSETGAAAAAGGEGNEGGNEKTAESPGDDDLPDESPIDIAAAASLVPLPEDGSGDGSGDVAENVDPEQAAAAAASANTRKRTYMQYLFGVAQQANAGAKGWWPEKMSVPSVPMPSMPSMPKVPSAVSSLGTSSLPGVNIFSKKQEASGDTSTGDAMAIDSENENENENQGPQAAQAPDTTEPQQPTQPTQTQEATKTQEATENQTPQADEKAVGGEVNK